MTDLHTDFKAMVTSFAEHNGWTVAEVDDDSAYLEFQGAAEDQPQILEIIRAEEDSGLIFSAPMSAGYQNQDDLPHEFSTVLLMRNTDLEIGYWCVEDIDGVLTYSCVAEVGHDEIDGDDFGEIVSALVHECDEVERLLNDMEVGNDE